MRGSLIRCVICASPLRSTICHRQRLTRTWTRTRKLYLLRYGWIKALKAFFLAFFLNLFSFLFFRCLAMACTLHFVSGYIILVPLLAVSCTRWKLEGFCQHAFSVKAPLIDSIRRKRLNHYATDLVVCILLWRRLWLDQAYPFHQSDVSLHSLEQAENGSVHQTRCHSITQLTANL